MTTTIVPTGTKITVKGRTLAKKLWPIIGTTPLISRTCSLIVRHAATHYWLMEDACNVEMSDEMEIEHEAKVERIEKRISDLVGSLPESPKGERFVAIFQGDPRGVTVKIKLEGVDRHFTYDGWASEAIMVPQR